jgi:hypothetical protein
MPVEEGRALLKQLTVIATQDKYVYRYNWRPKDLVMWTIAAADIVAGHGTRRRTAG